MYSSVFVSAGSKCPCVISASCRLSKALDILQQLSHVSYSNPITTPIFLSPHSYIRNSIQFKIMTSRRYDRYIRFDQPISCDSCCQALCKSALCDWSIWTLADVIRLQQFSGINYNKSRRFPSDFLSFLLLCSK